MYHYLTTELMFLSPRPPRPDDPHTEMHTGASDKLFLLFLSQPNHQYDFHREVNVSVYLTVE